MAGMTATPPPPLPAPQPLASSDAGVVPPWRIAIVGAGAIGGLIGFRLASRGHPVSLLARGATLAALHRHGLRLAAVDGVQSVAVAASDDPADLGVQDLVVLAVKAPALPVLAPTLGPLVGPHTLVLSAMNGVPWWFLDGLGEATAGFSLPAVDPDGGIAASLPAARTLGGVVHLAASAPEPGLVQPRMGDHLIVGEPSGGSSERVEALARTLRDAGFRVDVSPRIQRDVWFKLWGNLTMNPLSALCGATADRILDDELVRGFATRCMQEAAAVGARIGLPIDTDPEDRHAVTRKLGAFRTSMLQDVDAGRPVELDALVGAVRDLARQVQVPTPAIDALFGLARLHARTHGLYPAAR
jgi:2-dehydropantoate 2-reductase